MTLPAPAATRPVLVLIDGSGYIFRAYHAIRTDLTTAAGLPTRAIFGFARMMLKTLRDVPGTHLAVVWDKESRRGRQAIDPAYKTNRPPMPEDLRPQLPWIRRVAASLGLPAVEHEGWEADDVIATLSRRAVEAGWDVVVVTGDKDLGQLASEHVRLFDGMKELWSGPAEVEAKWGVPPDRVVDVQTLMGDSSDGVPGLAGVGEKTAAELVRTFGRVADVVRAAEEGRVKRPKIAAVILAGLDRLRLNAELVRLRDELPLDVELPALARRAVPWDEARALFAELEFHGLVRELAGKGGAEAAEGSGGALGADVAGRSAALRGSAAAAGAASKTPLIAPPPMTEGQELVCPGEPVDPPPTELVRDAAGLEALFARIADSRRVGLIATLPGQALHGPDGAPLVGIAVAPEEGAPAFLPLGRPTLLGAQGLDPSLVLPGLVRALRGVAWSGHETKRELVALHAAGAELEPPAGDAELAAFLLAPGRASYSIDALAAEVLGATLPALSSLTGTGRGARRPDELSPEELGPWLGRAAALARLAEERLAAKLHDRGLAAIYNELELPLVPLLAAMERAGIRLDVPRLATLGRELERELAVALAACHAAAGRPFNVASPKQLAELLFTELGLPIQRRTKTGPSTDHEVLERLAPLHALPKLILEHRSLAKLKGTYVDALPLLVERDGRLRTTFGQVAAETGRLSSNDPNLQNIPIRTEAGRKIRACFVPRPGWLLVSADYSQIELRILAHVTGDPGLCDALNAGADVHTRTAAEVFSVDESAVTKDQRRVAKMVNYAVAYGLSSFGLSSRLDIPPDEAKRIIARYFERYAGVRRWIDELLTQARGSGVVRTIDGRIRALPDLHAKNANVRQAAERAAINMPIQGTAADLMKRGMIGVAARLRREGLQATLLLQVHDELVFEAPPEELAALTAIAKEELAGAASMRVPLVVDVGSGATWADAHG